jgi:hypothetical protein
MPDSETFSCDAECVAETERAIRCRLETGDEVWIPKSVVHDDSEVYALDHSGKLVVAGWWAEKEGLS